MVVVQARVVDSTHLELSEPIELQQDERVVVLLAGPGDEDIEREIWLSASASSLLAACGEAEPEYSLGLVKESNPEYRG